MGQMNTTDPANTDSRVLAFLLSSRGEADMRRVWKYLDGRWIALSAVCASVRRLKQANMVHVFPLSDGLERDRRLQKFMRLSSHGEAVALAAAAAASKESGQPIGFTEIATWHGGNLRGARCAMRVVSDIAASMRRPK